MDFQVHFTERGELELYDFQILFGATWLMCVNVLHFDFCPKNVSACRNLSILGEYFPKSVFFI